ncbi:MAG TPA: hypothetical protein VKR55_26150 [Bradyrhizobium sp.]|uniref:hypothetical protein n=1 Tax=Bradyrhizobium sp. TaxID=376 RepID=UPI002C2B6FB0|nr:hypothetical protein [Bradyrhizobium sp.]HLZ05620.1 hypothetical protein [Bradyrhizobium sp.]
MKTTLGMGRVIVRRILSVAGAAAAATGLVSLASGQVFAHQFLQEMTPGPNIGMVYSPELQLMVKPGTTEPVYSNARDVPGSFKVATSAVTQGSGPNGAGPHHDSD